MQSNHNSCNFCSFASLLAGLLFAVGARILWSRRSQEMNIDDPIIQVQMAGKDAKN